MIEDTMKMSGLVTAHLLKANGVEITEQANMVVDAGKGWVANRMTDNDIPMSHMALGSSATSENLAQIVLVDEGVGFDAYTRQPCPGSTNVNAKTVTYSATWDANEATSNAEPIREAGIFNTDTIDAGTMLARTVFSGDITKDSSDILTITWEITIA